jgi:hypothetical protein
MREVVLDANVIVAWLDEADALALCRWTARCR